MLTAVMPSTTTTITAATQKAATSRAAKLPATEAAASHFWILDVFQEVPTAHFEAWAGRTPGLALLAAGPVIFKHAIKDRAILKGENAIAVLLVLLPFTLIAGACCIVQGSVTMPLPILKCALVPANTIALLPSTLPSVQIAQCSAYPAWTLTEGACLLYTVHATMHGI